MTRFAIVPLLIRPFPGRCSRRCQPQTASCLARCLLSFAVAALGTTGAVYVVPGAQARASDDKPLAKGADDRPILIHGGLLFDAAEAKTRANSMLLIKSGRIAEIGEQIAVDDGMNLVDAKGMTLLPGLIDLHVHFGAPAGEDLTRGQAALMADYMQQRPGVRRALLEAGVTSIRSVGDVVGNRWWGIVGLKAAAHDQRLESPRVFAVGPIFTAPKGHPAGTIYRGNSFLIENATRQVSEVDAAREHVAELAALGLDGVKVVYDDAGGRLPRLSQRLLAAIIDEAHQQGLWAAVHTGSNSDVRDAVAAGADTIEHGVTDGSAIEPKTVELLKSHRATYVPTLSVMESLLPNADAPGRQQRLDNLRAVHEAGVPVGAGTDTQGAKMQFGSSLHRELLLLVEAGLMPSEALQAATHNAARALNVEKELGTIEAGKMADVILVHGDPTENIEAVSDVRLVIQHGRVVVDRPAR